MICPSCETSMDTPFDSCPICGLDLTVLSQIRDRPIHYYNEAVEACRKYDWFEALEALAVTCHMNPLDLEAHILMGKVYIELNQLERAAACFIRAFRLDARNREASDALLWLKSQGCNISFETLMQSPLKT